jgi:hypothetical protein
VAILTQGSRDALRAKLRDFDERRFPFRVWWVRGSRWSEYDRLTPSSAWAWLTRRTPWSPLGGMPEYLEWSKRRPGG